MSKTVRLTTAQAIVKFLDQQYVSRDGEETKFVEAFFTLFGHGIAVGLGEALGVDLTYEEGPGIHNWIFWDAYIQRALNWLPLKNAPL